MNFVFCVLELSPTLRTDGPSAEHVGSQLRLELDELAFYYRDTRQRSDYTGDSERFSLNWRQKAVNRRLPQAPQLPNYKT